MYNYMTEIVHMNIGTYRESKFRIKVSSVGNEIDGNKNGHMGIWGILVMFQKWVLISRLFFIPYTDGIKIILYPI